MKRNEIIELNGVEYTLELNRDSFLQIDKICNVREIFNTMQKGLYTYIDDIDDNYNPFENMDDLTEESIKKETEQKEAAFKKLIERSMYIWMYPHHKLPISKVQEIVKPYIEDEEKANWLLEKIGYYLEQCNELKNSQQEQQKNLEALVSKKN